METYIQNIPKAELHLHIEGTLEPELMFRIAERNKITLKYKSAAELRQAYQFHNLQSFLDIYYEGTNVLINEEDFYDLTWEYLERIADQGVLHTEIFFDPQSHTVRNVPFATVITGITRALARAKKELNISSKLIMCFLRHLSEEEAFTTLEQALPYKDLIVAVGLDSSEKGNPPAKFERVFKKARDYGFLTVAHAGEEGSAEYVWQALNLLKVSRIDHGNKSLEDPKLILKLFEEQIPLTMCPLSNIKLCNVANLQEHPLKKMLKMGLCVTINSDDPAYFGGYIVDNYLESQKALNLSKEDIYQLANNSFKAAFLKPEEKEIFYEKLEAYHKLSGAE